MNIIYSYRDFKLRYDFPRKLAHGMIHQPNHELVEKLTDGKLPDVKKEYWISNEALELIFPSFLYEEDEDIFNLIIQHRKLSLITNDEKVEKRSRRAFKYLFNRLNNLRAKWIWKLYLERMKNDPKTDAFLPVRKTIKSFKPDFGMKNDLLELGDYLDMLKILVKGKRNLERKVVNLEEYLIETMRNSEDRVLRKSSFRKNSKDREKAIKNFKWSYKVFNNKCMEICKQLKIRLEKEPLCYKMVFRHNEENYEFFLPVDVIRRLKTYPVMKRLFLETKEDNNEVFEMVKLLGEGFEKYRSGIFRTFSYTDFYNLFLKEFRAGLKRTTKAKGSKLWSAIYWSDDIVDLKITPIANIKILKEIK